MADIHAKMGTLCLRCEKWGCVGAMRTRDSRHVASQRSGRDGKSTNPRISAHLGDKPVIWFGWCPQFVVASYPFLKKKSICGRYVLDCCRSSIESELLVVGSCAGHHNDQSNSERTLKALWKGCRTGLLVFRRLPASR